MKSDLPKVLQPLAGHPLLAHVLDAASALDPALIHVVYGHGGERVRTRGARTEPALGAAGRSSSAPATRCSRRCRACPMAHMVLVLYGDVPLIRPDDAARAAGARRPESWRC